MEKLKEALIQFTHSNPSLFPNDAAISYPVLIEQCFPHFFSDFHTPSHPPYAAMIYKAIRELNKKRGSSEELISEHIKKEYTDLPWAHSTLLKHHLEKLCDHNEIFMTDKQCYLLASAESDSEKKSSGTSKKCKKLMSQLGSEGGKKNTRPYKKSKKNEKSRSGVQKVCDKEQIGPPKRKRKKKQKLKSKRKSSKHAKKNVIINDTKLQLLDEANLKQNNEVTDDGSHEQKQASEVKMCDIQLQEQNGLHKRKRKHGLKSKKKSSKRAKKHMVNEDTKLQLLDEANLTQNEVNDDKSHEQQQTLEVKTGDIQIQEENEVGQESDHENSGCLNLEQTQKKRDLELLQPEESPDSNPTLLGNFNRVCTRSQLKMVLKKDALAASSELTDSLGCSNMLKDKPDLVEYLSNGKQQAMDIIEVKSTVDAEPLQILRSSSLEKPLIEFLNPMPLKLIPWFLDDEPTAAPSSTEVQDPISSQQDRQPEKLQLDDKPKYKRRGRPLKSVEPGKSKVNCQQSAKKLIPCIPDDEPTAAPSSEVHNPISFQQDQQSEKLLLDDKPKYKRRGRHPKPMKPEKSKVNSQQSAKKLIPRFPDDEPTIAPSSTEVQDPISSQENQQPEKLPLVDNPNYKRRGRHPKRKEPVKSKVKSQQSAKKGKVGKKKGQSKYKGHARHKMTRRSSRKPSY